MQNHIRQERSQPVRERRIALYHSSDQLPATTHKHTQYIYIYIRNTIPQTDQVNEKHLREQGQHYRSYKQQTTDEMEPRISQVDEEVFSVDTSVQCGTGSLSLSL